MWGRKNVKEKEKNEISVGEEKCKSQEKKKKKKNEWNINHLLNIVGKKKILQSCLEWRKGPTWIFGLCIMCFVKSFDKFCMDLIMSLNSMKSLEPL